VNDVSSRRDRRRTFLAVLGIGLAVMVIAAPFATATHTASHVGKVLVVNGATKPVPVKGAVQIRGLANKGLEAQAVPAMGLAGAQGSPGALAVRTYGGGGGFLGAGDCTVTAADGLDNVVDVTNSIITGIIITGDNPGVTAPDGLIRVTSDFVDATGALSVSNFRVDAATPNVFIGLGNGLTATDAIHFTGFGQGGGPGSCKFIILGQTGI
jgi:hypothetical protein